MADAQVRVCQSPLAQQRAAADIARIEAALAAMPKLRRATSGEFTRRAFVNGKLDLAEAEGLGKKFGALDSLSDNARAHEEFRMQLEKSFEEAMAAIAANKDIAKDQAEVLATALAKAKIEIVGGEGDFFNSFAKSLSVGKAIEGVVGKSPVVQDVLSRLLAGKAAPAAPVAAPGAGSEKA